MELRGYDTGFFGACGFVSGVGGMRGGYGMLGGRDVLTTSRLSSSGRVICDLRGRRRMRG
jgi:hypothetical protein